MFHRFHPQHLLFLLLSMFAAIAATASDKSVTIFPAEGNKTCSDYAANKVVLSLGVNSPISNTNVTLSGPDRTAPNNDGLPEQVVYYLSADGKTLKFDPTSTNTPIDYAVLKSGSTVSVIIYPAGGVTSDQNMSIPGSTAGSTLPITGFSLCYNLNNKAPVPVKTTTPSCSDKMSLDLQGITCNGGAPVLICSIELDKPFFGMKSGDRCCVCNHDALVECDPNLAEGAAGACPGPTHNSTPKEVQTNIEINKDPYYCITSGGTKTCYLY
ncbi:MAG: hypothetical protein JNJ60_05820 [Rhodocyclaceae bacterium]|nr:hypothetical protein [Rhodocyclaceae bacterium]